MNLKKKNIFLTVLILIIGLIVIAFYYNNKISDQEFVKEKDSASFDDQLILESYLDFQCGEDIEYANQSYRTVEIGEQCWLAENLNVGLMITHDEMPDPNNDVIEKWCWDDAERACERYGALYSWDEALQGSSEEGVQGVCPPGWHIPTDDDFKELELTIGLTEEEVDKTNYRGNLDVIPLRSVKYYKTDIEHFGFNGLFVGHRSVNGSFNGFGTFFTMWTSTLYDSSDAWYRNLIFDVPLLDHLINRSHHNRDYGFSIRCLATRPSFNITYIAGEGGRIEGEPEQKLIWGTPGSRVTAIPNRGFSFVSWSDGKETPYRSDYNLTKDTIVTANFAVNYDLSYSAGPNGSIEGDGFQIVVSGSDSKEVLAIPDDNYRFVSWSDGVTDNPRTDTNVKGDIRVRAIFERE